MPAKSLKSEIIDTAPWFISNVILKWATSVVKPPFETNGARLRIRYKKINFLTFLTQRESNKTNKFCSGKIKVIR